MFFGDMSESSGTSESGGAPREACGPAFALRVSIDQQLRPCLDIATRAQTHGRADTSRLLRTRALHCHILLSWVLHLTGKAEGKYRVRRGSSA